ncbi:MAG TPA: outer membrane beta-barrel protein, partial [Candidatus Krumholzibacteria bacterium]|nr:outer membrane beta-barrel protein [Candidatus Krumholzibacteria bacterium]
MKRFVTAGAVVMLVAFAAGSASAEAAWRMGVKGGLALSDFGGSDVEEDIGNRIAFVGGMYAQADVSDRFGIRLEALYHMKGASEDSAGVAATVKLDYLEFPVLVVGQVP